MFPGVRPNIRRASSPIALIRFVSRSKATTLGSFNTTPFPFTYTNMLAVPKSIPISKATLLISFHYLLYTCIAFPLSIHIINVFPNISKFFLQNFHLFETTKVMLP